MMSHVYLKDRLLHGNVANARQTHKGEVQKAADSFTLSLALEFFNPPEAHLTEYITKLLSFKETNNIFSRFTTPSSETSYPALSTGCLCFLVLPNYKTQQTRFFYRIFFNVRR